MKRSFVKARKSAQLSTGEQVTRKNCRVSLLLKTELISGLDDSDLTYTQSREAQSERRLVS